MGRIRDLGLGAARGAAVAAGDVLWRDEFMHPADDIGQTGAHCFSVDLEEPRR